MSLSLPLLAAIGHVVAGRAQMGTSLGPQALLIAALRPAAFATLAGAVWIVVSPWVLGYATTQAAWANELITGLLLIVLCLTAGGLARVPVRRPRRRARNPSSSAARPSESLRAHR
jgi:hypothetical protein